MGTEIVLQQPDEGDFKGQGAVLVMQSQELVIESAEDYEQAAGWLQEVKGKFKVLWERLNDPCQKAKAAHAAMCKIRDEAVAPFEKAEAEIKFRMGEYNAKLEMIRRQEQLEAQAKAELEARKERDRQIAEAKKAKDKAAVEALKIAPLEVAPAAPATPALSKQTGVSHRKVWKVQAIDRSKLPPQYLMPDVKAIEGVVRSLGGKHGIPGVVAVEEMITVVRA